MVFLLQHALVVSDFKIGQYIENFVASLFITSQSHLVVFNDRDDISRAASPTFANDGSRELKHFGTGIDKYVVAFLHVDTDADDDLGVLLN